MLYSFDQLRFVSLLALLLAPVIHFPASAQPTAPPQRSIFDLLSTPDGDMRPLSLSAPFDSLFRGDQKDIEADLGFEDDTGAERHYQIKLELRGRYRRRICDFPPMKLDFDKDELEAEGLTMSDDIKLVTHCMDEEESRQIVLRELLAYRLYSLLDSVHLRTQAVQIQYLDTGSGSRNKEIGFLIEDEDELASRMGLFQCDDCMAIDSSQWDRRSLLRTALFQYMIGNADWSPFLARNVKLLSISSDSSWFCVPYDFDFSGLVNAFYAIPRIELGQLEIGQRIYLGPPATESEIEAQFAYFLEKKPLLRAATMDFPWLGKPVRKQLWRYIESFFEEMENGELARICLEASAYGAGF